MEDYTMNFLSKHNQITGELQECMRYMDTVNQYANELHDLSKTWDNLEFLSQFGNTKTNLSIQKTNFLSSLQNYLVT
jgi:hypothetical protein